MSSSAKPTARRPGFLFGWATFLVVQTGTIAAVAVAFAKFLGVLAPAVAADHYPLFRPIPLGDLGLRAQPVDPADGGRVPGRVPDPWSTRSGAPKTGTAIQNTFTFTKTAALIALIVVGIFFGANRGGAAFTSPGGLPRPTAGPPRGPGEPGAVVGPLAFLLLLGKAMIGPLFSQTAWNSVTFTGGEIREPGRTLPRALVVGCGSVVGLYLLANVAYLLTLLPSTRSRTPTRGGWARR